MSVASLRAYGLNEDLLDELALTRISGLTFAPEAGTQRMRDVVNKNVTEAHIEESARRVFSRGWHRLKLYFMIGLPTEEDDDVRGIVETGQRMLRDRPRSSSAIAPRSRSASARTCPSRTRRSSGARRTRSTRSRASRRSCATTARATQGLRLKHHDSGISFVEGVLARGDRRLADVIERVWRAGARFDGWDEVLRARALAATRSRRTASTSPAYLGTRPVDARGCRGTTSTSASRTASCSASTARR